MQMPEFIRLAKYLNQHEVKFMVVGGFAVNHYGYKRTTSDIDLYLKDSVENRTSLVEALDSMGYGRMEELMTAPILAGYCEIMMDDGFYVDLMTEIPGLNPNDYDDQYARRNVQIVNSVEISYINYQDLLLNKEKTGRLKDVDDKSNLEKINQ